MRTTSEIPAPASVWRGAFAGLAALFVGIGLARFAYTPLIPALIAAHWFLPSAAVYLGAANLAGYLAGAMLARRLSLLAPAPAVLRATMLLTALSFAACAWPAGFAWFFPWRLLSGFTGGVLMVLAAPTVLAHTPVARRGRVSGIVFTGVGLGIAASGTLVPMLAGWDLTVTWLGLAAVTALLTAASWRGWPAEAAPQPGPAAGAASRPALSLPVALLLLAYGCDAAGFVPHTVFWVDYIARGLDLGLAVGGGYWIIFGLGAVAGPLVVGLAADRAGFAASFTAALLLKGLAVGLPVVWSGPSALVLSSLIVGALTPGTTALLSGWIVELLGPENQKQVWGWMTTAFALAQAAVAYAMSFLFAETGSYRLLFAIGCASLLIATLAALVVSRRTAANVENRRAARSR